MTILIQILILNVIIQLTEQRFLNNYLLKERYLLIMTQYSSPFLLMVFNYGEFQTMVTQH